jgi:geranylgeranyl diphosphate synthase type II
MDVETSIQKINQTLAQYTFGSQPVDLYQPMHYMLGLDQKRMCPLLTFWGCYLFSGNTKKVLMPSLGVEVFHNFLLVHEDLMERNPTRNGRDSVHVKWNDNVAILSGDAMIFKAYELIIQVDQKLIKPVIRLFNQCFTKVCEGKQLSLKMQDDTGDSEQYFKILQLKPGALTGFSLQLGALIGGATQEQGEQVGNLGNDLGAFWALDNNQSFNPSILQSFSTLDCNDRRKREFELWTQTITQSMY